jgi:hypothetical protein
MIGGYPAGLFAAWTAGAGALYHICGSAIAQKSFAAPARLVGALAPAVFTGFSPFFACRPVESLALDP